MLPFETMQLSDEPDAVAPDGSDVRILLGLASGTLAHFALPRRATSVAVQHCTISEIWFFVSGAGQMWRSQDGHTEIVEVGPGTCITIPVGTAFQFRSLSDELLAAVGIAMPPWPGAGEAAFIDGPWTPTVEAGPA